MIINVTQSGYMPPWQADPEFRSFKNERFLDSNSKNLILKWAETGLNKGRKKDYKYALESKFTLGNPDLILSISKQYQLSDQSIEDYRFFNIPTDIPEDTYLSAVEFVPGNKRVIHHSRIMIDTTNQIRGIDGLSEFDPKSLEFQKKPLADEFFIWLGTWKSSCFLPFRNGKKDFKNSDLILNIHYSPTSRKEIDSSQIKLYFAKDKIQKEINVLTIREGDIANQPFLYRQIQNPLFTSATH